MKLGVAKYSYDEYRLYVCFHKKEGRWYANLIPIDSTKRRRTTMSYARYLMSVKLGRILESWEHVDHIDNDKTNDSIENLQLLTLAENNIKYAKFHGIRYVKLRCPNCGKIFSRERRNTFLQKPSNNYAACSRRCSGQFGVKFAKSPNSQEVLDGISKNVVCEYMYRQLDH